MLVSLLMSFALAASTSVVCGQDVSSGREIQKRDSLFIFASWFVDTPSPSDFGDASSTYDMHEQTGDWFALPTDEDGLELNDDTGALPASKNGYRLTNDPSSSIIWFFSASNTQVTGSSFSGTSPSADIDISVDFAGALDATYTSTVPSNTTSTTDPWDSTSTGTTLVTSKSLFIQNSECNGSLNFTVTTLDADGVTLVFTGTDSLNVDVPTALPANITVESSNTTAGVVLTYNGVEPVSVILGDGDNVPVPKASFAGTIQFCPD